MKKILAVLLTALFAVHIGFAETLPSFSRLALRDISSGSESDSSAADSEEAEYKSTKKLRGWWFPLTLGMNIPVSNLTVKLDNDDLDAEHTAVAFQVGGLAMNLENGFTIKYDYNIGGGFADKLEYDNKGKEVDMSGFDMSLNIALGWAPLRTEHFRLALLGSMGIQFDYLTGDGKYTYGNSTYSAEYTNVLFDFNIGFDIFTAVQFNKHFGLYFDLGFKGIVAGNDSWTMKVGNEKANHDYELSGSRWVPSFGCLITF